MKQKGKKGGFFQRLFADPEEPSRERRTGSRPDEEDSRRKPARRFRILPEEPDYEENSPEEILAKYGKYLDEDGVPFQGINPKPKYYVVPKETPTEALPDEPLTPPPAPKPKKATVRKVKPNAPTKVVIRKRARPEPPESEPKKVTVRKKATSPAPADKPTTVTVKVKSKKS